VQTGSENAAGIGDYACLASFPTRRAYLEWLRQRVLGRTGRPLAEGETGLRRHPKAVRRVEGGDPRFWTLVTVPARPSEANFVASDLRLSKNLVMDMMRLQRILSAPWQTGTDSWPDGRAR
jgi:hypothetical protein